jgi:hypothetical protein
VLSRALEKFMGGFIISASDEIDPEGQKEAQVVFVKGAEIRIVHRT